MILQRQQGPLNFDLEPVMSNTVALNHIGLMTYDYSKKIKVKNNLFSKESWGYIVLNL